MDIVTAAAGAGIGQATVRSRRRCECGRDGCDEKRTMEVAEDLKSKEYKAMGGAM